MKTFKTLPAKLPAHFLCGDSCQGGLYDTRKPQWSAGPPLRPVFQFQFNRIETTAQLKATLRAGSHAWPGGYPLYFITSDGAALSFASVRENLREVLDAIKTRSRNGWKVEACEINWEDGDLICDHSGDRIESAYAEA